MHCYKNEHDNTISYVLFYGYVGLGGPPMLGADRGLKKSIYARNH